MKTSFILIILVISLSLFVCKERQEARISIKTNIKGFNKNAFKNALADDFAIAYYGHVPYGTTLFADVVLADPIDACTPIKPDPYNGKKIFIAKRDGDCDFAKKTLNIQNAGGIGAIIVNNEYQIEKHIAVLGTDRFEQIKIPTLLFGIQAEDILIKPLEDLNNDENIEDRSKHYLKIKIQFNLPKQQKRVKIDFWLDAFNWESYLFLDKLYHDKTLYALLSDVQYIDFNPHYAIWYCSECAPEYTNFNDDDCIKGGRYCSPDPDNEIFSNGPMTGKDVVEEDLRQKCLWSNYGSNKGYFEDWLDYMTRFKSECLVDKNYKNTVKNVQECSAKILREDLDLSANMIDVCVEDQKGTSRTGQISLLEEDMNDFVSEGIQTWPALVINGAIYKGDIFNIHTGDDTDTSLVATICNSITYSKKHPICKTLGFTQYSQSNNNLSVAGIIFIIIISTLVLVALTIFFYRRILKKELNKDVETQVSNAISQYMAFYESKQNTSQI